jgi:hypothetical protein
MNRSSRAGRRTRHWIALAVIPFAFVLAASQVAAASDDSGNVGVHTLIDTTEYPAVTCTYRNPGDLLHTMNVRAPIIFAFDRTAGTDSQTVGWRFRIQRATTASGSTDYAPFYVSPTWKAVTTDRRAAQLSPRAYTFASQIGGFRYRILYDLYWYYPSAHKVDGRAVHLNTYYLGIEPNLTFTWAFPCISAD